MKTTTACLEKQSNDQRHSDPKRSAQGVESFDIDEFNCPECGGPIVTFMWPIWLCLVCHKRRNDRQAQTGKSLLSKLDISDRDDHSDENPF
jgi:ribosomal protein L37AE/L43A